LAFCQKVGLPEISPVEALIRKPLGRDGLTLNVRIAPPVLLEVATVVLTAVLKTALLLLRENRGRAKGVGVGEGVGASCGVGLTLAFTACVSTAELDFRFTA